MTVRRVALAVTFFALCVAPVCSAQQQARARIGVHSPSVILSADRAPLVSDALLWRCIAGSAGIGAALGSIAGYVTYSRSVAEQGDRPGYKVAYTAIGGVAGALAGLLILPRALHCAGT